MSEPGDAHLDRAAILRRRAGREPVWLPVVGDSMGSTIRPPGRVLVDASGPPPRRGEIWAFESSDGLVVHRFRSRHEDRYWFRGDGNLVDDRPVSPAALIGRVLRVDDAKGNRRVGRLQRLAGRALLDLDSARRRLGSSGRRRAARRRGRTAPTERGGRRST